MTAAFFILTLFVLCSLWTLRGIDKRDREKYLRELDKAEPMTKTKLSKNNAIINKICFFVLIACVLGGLVITLLDVWGIVQDAIFQRKIWTTVSSIFVSASIISVVNLIFATKVPVEEPKDKPNPSVSTTQTANS